jgi:MFS family permease
MTEKISWNEVRTILLSAAGSALEYYDFTVFVFLASILSDVFFPKDSPEWIRLLQTYSVFALGYFVRPIGGIVIAHFGDRVGRKKMFMFSIFIMAVPTLCIGLLPTYAQVGWLAPGLLLLMRLLQGFAIAGELPGGMVFVGEHAVARRIGTSCATLQGIMFLGLALGSSTTGLITTFIPNVADQHSYGWRLPFIAGGVFGLITVYLRRYLQETPLFDKLKETKNLSRKLPLMEVIRNHAPACLFVAGLALFLNQITTVMFQYMPTLLIWRYHVPSQTVFWANTVGVVSYACMCLVWGALGDFIGRGRAMVLGACLTGIAAIWMFSGLGDVTTGGASLMGRWCLVGLAGGFVGLIPSLAVSLFPTTVRLTGFSFPYNLATAFSAGVTPVALTWLLNIYGRGAPVYFALLGCVGFCIVGLLFERMTRYLGDVGVSAPALSIDGQVSNAGAE